MGKTDDWVSTSVTGLGTLKVTTDTNVSTDNDLRMVRALEHSISLYGDVSTQKLWNEIKTCRFENHTITKKGRDIYVTRKYDGEVVAIVEEGNEKVKCAIARHINGISLNGLEFVLEDDQETIKPFDNKDAAISFLLENGAHEDDVHFMRFLNYDQLINHNEYEEVDQDGH